MDNAYIIKFTNGIDVIALLADSEKFSEKAFIKISYPIEVVAEQAYTGEQLVERFSLKPWNPLANDVTMVVASDSIITVSILREEYAGGYERMVNRYFFSDDELDEERIEQDETSIVLAEYLQAKRNNSIN